MSRTVRIEVLRLPASADLPLPSYGTSGSAGLDIRAAVEDERRIEPGATEVVPTGLAVAIPPGWEAQIRPRSGLAVQHGITLVNSPATIDSDYRGELLVPLINLGTDPFAIRRGIRIAQLVFAPVATAVLVEVSELRPSVRGESGFGHTGLD